MEQRTWHFPPPFRVSRLSKGAEQQLFYDLAKEFSEIIQREVNINRGNPINFEDRSTNIHYHALQFELSLRLEKNHFYHDYPESIIKITWLGVSPHNLGYGTKLMKHFLRRLSSTSYERVILDTRDEEGRRFWSRLGFTPDCEDSPLDWFMNLPRLAL